MLEFFQAVFGFIANTVGVLVLPLLIAAFPLYGLLKRVAVYEAFVEGAKEGFSVAVRIIPYLVAILFAIGMFRASGLMDVVKDTAGPVVEWVGVPSGVVPMAIVRPLTGGGSVGVLADVQAEYGTDSRETWTAATIFGSTETTFYVIAVYFGAAGIKRTRHAVAAGLTADIAAVFLAAWVVLLFRSLTG
jgi:spore maturation protein B